MDSTMSTIAPSFTAKSIGEIGALSPDTNSCAIAVPKAWRASWGSSPLTQNRRPRRGMPTSSPRARSVRCASFRKSGSRMRSAAKKSSPHLRIEKGDPCFEAMSIRSHFAGRWRRFARARASSAASVVCISAKSCRRDEQERTGMIVAHRDPRHVRRRRVRPEHAAHGVLAAGPRAFLEARQQRGRILPRRMRLPRQSDPTTDET